MDAMFTVTQAEAREAMEAYLKLRGVLPAHGQVVKVKQSSANGYEPSLEVEAKVGPAPVLEPPSSPDNSTPVEPNP